MTVPTMYSIDAAVREFIGDITVAQFDGSPAASYKLSLHPHNVALTSPDTVPADWHDPDTKYGVQGLWVGAAGTVQPAASLDPYLLHVVQLVDGVWSQARLIGIVFVRGDISDSPLADDVLIIDGGFLG